MDPESKHTKQLNLWIPRQARNDGKKKGTGPMHSMKMNQVAIDYGLQVDWNRTTRTTPHPGPLPQGAREISLAVTLIGTLIAFIILLPALSFAAGPASKKVTFLQKNGKPGACAFTVEMAVTPQEQERGLMFREHMDADAGMLFDFGGDGMRYFWMRNTLIPLDMIFISSDMRVVHVHRWARPKDETSVTSKFPARYVLEINGGRAATCRIDAGSKARFSNLSP